jgi:hypothetical protein
MTWLSALWSLIKKLIELFKRKQEEPEQYTREQFIEAVKELSNDAVWRARILKDALSKLREQRAFETKWVSKDEIIEQTTHRVFGCGISYVFGDGIYALSAYDWHWLIEVLQQDSIKYVSEFTDCDNFATFFKGFADYVVGKPVVIYTTGLVFTVAEQMGVKTCLCKLDYLVGGHGWNRIVMSVPTHIKKIGSTEEIVYDFTVYNYEPQEDMLGGRILGNWCYMSGGGLPVIYGKRDDI